MSKEAALRAMREARYNARSTPTAAGSRPARPAVRPAESLRPAEAAEPVVEGAAAGEALCGHRSMNGRTCTREHGHDAKSHRYS